jgi:hypothetical protein
MIPSEVRHTGTDECVRHVPARICDARFVSMGIERQERRLKPPLQAKARATRLSTGTVGASALNRDA